MNSASPCRQRTSQHEPLSTLLTNRELRHQAIAEESPTQSRGAQRSFEPLKKESGDWPRPPCHSAENRSHLAAMLLSIPDSRFKRCQLAVGSRIGYQTGCDAVTVPHDRSTGRTLTCKSRGPPTHDSRARGCPSVSCSCLRPAARRGCRTGLDGRAHRNRQRCPGRSDFRSSRSPRLASNDRRVDDADDERQRATALPVSRSGTVRAGHQHAGVCALT